MTFPIGDSLTFTLTWLVNCPLQRVSLSSWLSSTTSHTGQKLFPSWHYLFQLCSDFDFELDCPFWHASINLLNKGTIIPNYGWTFLNYLTPNSTKPQLSSPVQWPRGEVSQTSQTSPPSTPLEPEVDTGTSLGTLSSSGRLRLFYARDGLWCSPHSAGWIL